ncbi:hypothetical protein [Vibrio harveyi]|uniref:hypothetical protein n=1 Tax=Vibrio harveyi TaxID=669 RepID=UPI0024803227|nr:hypothetical protein [Vibrio harveyi]
MQKFVYYAETVSIVRKSKSGNYLDSATVKSTERAAENMRRKVLEALEVRSKEHEEKMIPSNAANY